MHRGTDTLTEQKLLAANEIVVLTVKYSGCVFGSYLCEFFGNTKPENLQIVLPSNTFGAFNDDLVARGYQKDPKTKYSSTIYVHTTRMQTIEVFVRNLPSDSAQHKRLHPYGTPDYDVNSLAYDNDGLFCWFGDFDVTNILDHIHKKVAISIQPSIADKAKFATKGFTIVA